MFGKKNAQQQSASEAAAEAVLADEAYREELRQLGREHFKAQLSHQTEHINEAVASMLEGISLDIQAHASRQIDALVSRVNTEVLSRVDQQMREFGQASSSAQELMTQSLGRNAQLVHEKYQKLVANLQQVVADQEVAMVTVFQDSKNSVASLQREQAKMTEGLRETEQAARQQVERLSQDMQQLVASQSRHYSEVYQTNTDQVSKAHQAQGEALARLEQTTAALESQYQQLSELLEKSITEQKTMASQMVNDNLARIVEHYVVSALGDQADVRSQLPAILQRMEAQKQAMIEDMTL